jgi:hypothetical protein
LVTDLIEYESTGGGGAFGAVVGGGKPKQEAPVQEKAQEKHEQEPDFDDTIPF